MAGIDANGGGSQITVIVSHLHPCQIAGPKSNPGRSKVKPRQEQRQTPAGAKSNPGRRKINPGRNKIKPGQEQSQTLCPHFQALCSVQFCIAHFTDIVVQCRARPTNTATHAH